MNHRLLLLGLVILLCFFPATSSTVIPGTPLRWSIVNVPATGSQAVATKAAGAANAHHILECLGFSAADILAPTLSFVEVEVLDGATVVWSYGLTFTAAAGNQIQPFTACGLGITGSGGNSMTVEFSAGVTNVAETVMATGYDILQ